MVKENDGKQSMRRERRRLSLAMVVLVCLGLALVRIIRMARLDRAGANARPMRVQMNGKVGASNTYDTHHPQERAVLEGKYFLIDIDISFGALADKGLNKTHYGAVTGIFCPLDWSLQKTNPSTVPMFRVLVADSKHCNPNRVRMDLREIAKKARLYDSKETQAGAAPGAVAVKPLKLGGVAFHESRCGSTLVSNLLVASNPTAHRVYSESTPPITALRACQNHGEDSENCSRIKQVTLLRDIFYLMSRSQAASRETHVFFKIQSVGVQSINVFTQAFPETPWIFVYRDPVEVIMSHLKHGGDGAKRAVCLRTKSTPPKLVRQLVKRQGENIRDLSTTEYCAAHLATLCASAMEEYKRRDAQQGRMVNYASLPDVMWESVLPYHFDLGTNEVGEEEVERMKTMAEVYSKGFGERADRKWEPDSEHKRDGATNSMRKAAKLFLTGLYEEMEATHNEVVDDDSQKEENDQKQDNTTKDER